MFNSKIAVLCLFLVGCAQSSGYKNYPELWWVNLGSQSLKSWEVNPSSVQPPKVVLSKRNELGVLSNFAATPFIYKGKHYASMEGFWQATKYPENKKDPRYKLAQWPHTRAEVEQMIGFQAKRAGSFASKVMKKHKIDWVTFAGQKMQYREMAKGDFYQLIRGAMQEKVKQNSLVKNTLLATKGLTLLPDHDQGPNPPPAWRYHEIYMEFRDSL